MASPRWKVYSAAKEYRGSLKYVEEAAAVIAMLGDGATIRDGHTKVMWTEGEDGQAGESYDKVAVTVECRAHPAGQPCGECAEDPGFGRSY